MMSEKLRRMPSAEEKVFGAAYSFVDGFSDEETLDSYHIGMLKRAMRGQSVWVPKFALEENKVYAELYKNYLNVAMVEYDISLGLASVYKIDAEDATLLMVADQVTFDIAVSTAESFLNQA